jgi:hypothetical protein
MPWIPYRWRRFLFPALAAALGYAAWTQYGGKGLLLAVLMLSFWVLLQFTQLMRLLRTAATRPLGHVSDAPALRARLQRGMPMAHVVRLTRSLGQRIDTGTDPGPGGAECFEWGDEQGHVLRAHFVHGRLDRFEMRRVEADSQLPVSSPVSRSDGPPAPT